jgi:hypothetical protein
VRYIHVQYTAHGRVVTNNYDQIQVYRHWLELGSLLLGAGLPTMEGSEGVGETGEYAGGGVSVWQKQNNKRDNFPTTCTNITKYVHGIKHRAFNLKIF